jgi:hypothetical protein
MMRQASNWGVHRLEDALGVLTDTDLSLRSAGATAPAAALVERAIIPLAMLSRKCPILRYPTNVRRVNKGSGTDPRGQNGPKDVFQARKLSFAEAGWAVSRPISRPVWGKSGKGRLSGVKDVLHREGLLEGPING